MIEETDHRECYRYRVRFHFRAGFDDWARENLKYGEWAVMHEPVPRSDGRPVYIQWVMFQHYEDAFAYHLRWG